MSNLTRGQVRKLSKRLRAQGRKLPKIGWCQNVSDVVKGDHRIEVCHYPSGYFFVGARHTNAETLSGAIRRGRRG